jgi:hypothetical protein
MAGDTGLEPVWTFVVGFGGRCNRRYANPLLFCTTSTYMLANGDRTLRHPPVSTTDALASSSGTNARYAHLRTSLHSATQPSRRLQNVRFGFLELRHWEAHVQPLGSEERGRTTNLRPLVAGALPIELPRYWSPVLDSNQRQPPYQDGALPTELTGESAHISCEDTRLTARPSAAHSTHWATRARTRPLSVLEQHDRSYRLQTGKQSHISRVAGPDSQALQWCRGPESNQQTCFSHRPITLDVRRV